MNSQNKSPQLIQVNPSQELVFNYQPQKILPSNITITNIYNNRISFKIRTNSKNQYTVKPNNGFLKPQETVVVDIKLQPLVNFNVELIKNDKFQILACEAVDTNINVHDIWKHTSEQNQQQFKVQVVLKDDQFEQIPNPPASYQNSTNNNFHSMHQQIQSQSTDHSLKPVMVESIVVERSNGYSSNDNTKRTEEMKKKCQQQEIMLYKLSEERNQYRNELEQLKSSMGQKIDVQGFQFWHVILVAIVSLLCGAVISNN